ncbi:MAG: trypsin-like peptidase domain-containing protein [Candidatus Coproplasma sp.]
MTQKELADKLSVTAQTVSKWENGVNQLDIAYLKEISALFGISADEFLRLADGQSLESVLIGSKDTGENPSSENTLSASNVASVAYVASADRADNSGGAVAQSQSEKAKAFLKNNLPSVVTAIVLFLVIVALTITAVCVTNVSLSANQIYEKVNPSVFYIEVTTEDGKQAGSGFFIDKNGTAVTNYHVIKGGNSAKVTLPDGNKYDVEQVIGCDSARDLVVIKVGIGRSLPVERGNSNKLKTGDKVYAIGYPESFILGSEDSTFTDGIISKPAYNIDGVNYIQTTVDITHGNSGGVLINSEGKVVGITTGKIDLGGVTYMNLALPVNNIGYVKSDINLPLNEFSSIYKDVTVTYMAGEEVYSQKTVANGGFAPQASGERVGYKFEGWFEDGEYLTPFDFDKPIDGDTLIYGKWTANTYYIEFIADGGTGQIERLQVEYGQSITLSANRFEKEGYDLIYWQSSKGNTTYYNGTTVKNLTHVNGETVYLTAVWEIKTCYINYYVDGLAIHNTHVNWGEDVPQYQATKWGYHVEKWYSDEALTQQYVFSKADQTTIKLYAKWTVNTYYIEFDANGGSGLMERQAVKYDQYTRLNANQFTKKGYNFVHWTFNDNYYLDTADIYCLADEQGAVVTMTAVWKPIKYKVEFNGYNGSYYWVDLKEYSYEDTVTFIDNEITTATAYFLGWEYKGNVYPAGYQTSKLTSKDGEILEVEAVVRKVKFQNPAGESHYSPSTTSLSFTTDSVSFSITAPTLGSNTFLGWKYKDTIYSCTDTITGLTTDDRDVTLVSQWSVMNVTCYFIETTDSGEEVTATLVSEFGDYIPLPKPKYQRSGYTFAGWRFQNGSTLYSAGEQIGFSMSTSNSERYIEAVYEASATTLSLVDEGVSELNCEQLNTANFAIGAHICADECILPTLKSNTEATV